MKKGFQLFCNGQSEGHCFYITNDGKLFSFGGNTAYKLARISQVQYRSYDASPGEVKIDSNNVNVIKVALGSDHSAFLTNDNKVYTIGKNDEGQLGTGDFLKRIKPVCIERNVANLFAGYNTSFVIMMIDGTCLGTGSNMYGQLGIGSNLRNENTLVKVKIKEKVVSIYGGCEYVLFHSRSGNLFKTGHIDDDLLTTIPVKLVFPGNERIIKADAGESHFLAISEKGTVFSMGNTEDNKIPCMSQKPIILECLSKENIVDVKCGYLHSLMLTKNGTVLCWGELMRPYSSVSIVRKGVTIHILKENIAQIEVGDSTFFLFDKNGQVWVGGQNGNGECGVGDSRDIQKVRKNMLVKDVKFCSFDEAKWIFSTLSRASYTDIIIKTSE